MFEIKEDGFYLDGKPFRLYSGAMHYFRVLPELWDDRFAKMKAAGFNAVETVACWNMHEPREGEFNFDGGYDVVRFIETAAKYDLCVIFRPGPYTCGEWDFGGLPAWLLQDKNLRIRCNDKDFLAKVENYFAHILKLIEPLQASKGGNVIAMQIENEYGSYGNDKEYLAALENIIRKNGINLPLFTSDGNCRDMISGGTLPHIYKTLNFGSHSQSAMRFMQEIQPDMPKTCMEFWCGWFDHWGEIHHKRGAGTVTREIKKLIGLGANINIYMFHGGTNFGFGAGANYARRYMPTVTSYDDAALLNEYGDYTEAYHKVRRILLEARGLPADTPLPPRPALQDIGEVQLNERGGFWSNLTALGERHVGAAPESMERFGQNFGYILYRKRIQGHYGAHTLYVEGAHDIVYVRVNGRLVKRYDRTRNVGKRNGDGFKVKLPAFDGEMLLEILVEGMGRINYGSETENDRKGIQKARLDYQTLFGWEMFCLPFDNLGEARFEGALDGAPSIMRGRFAAQAGKDCFVDMKGFKKGFVTVNGFNIGRYWERGPQRSLYIPAPILREENEITVVEQEGYAAPRVRIGAKHYL